MIPVVRTYRRLPSIIDEFLKDDLFGGRIEKPVRYSVPAINILEDDNGYIIEIAAPGFEKEDLKVFVDANVLTISSVKEEKKDEKSISYLKKEFGLGSFSRSFELPENADVEKIDASNKNGVLFVNIPKKAVVQIPVQEVEVK